MADTHQCVAIDSCHAQQSRGAAKFRLDFRTSFCQKRSRPASLEGGTAVISASLRRPAAFALPRLTDRRRRELTVKRCRPSPFPGTARLTRGNSSWSERPDGPFRAGRKRVPPSRFEPKISQQAWHLGCCASRDAPPPIAPARCDSRVRRVPISHCDRGLEDAADPKRCASPTRRGGRPRTGPSQDPSLPDRGSRTAAGHPNKITSAPGYESCNTARRTSG
jgi:hypothetical protein